MLRSYQIQLSNEGLQILKQYMLLYYCMAVRTGKTLTALATADKYGAKCVLFLTKKKAIASIKKDFQSLRPEFDLYVTNYENVHTIDGTQFDLVILDEAHCLGSFPVVTQRAKLVKKICANKPVIFLSGSPTPESYSQIFHQLHCSCFSPFAEYKSFYKWANDGFVKIKQRRFSHGLVNDYSNADKAKIDAATKHFFLSYTQEAAGFTAMVNEQVIEVKMKDSTYYLAEKLRARRVHIGKDGDEVIGDTEVKLMQKLHQVYSGTVLTESNKIICFDDSKARAIKMLFNDKKIAIFYKFRGELQLLQSVFGESRITDSPEEFNRRHDLIFCAQIQSAREGINLSTADALVFFNIDYSHLSYLQARARSQVKERETPCNIYWIFSEGGIESKIYVRVIAKQDYNLSYFRKDFKVEQIKKVA